MCDALLPSSEITLSEDEYICTQCSSQENSKVNVDGVQLFTAMGKGEKMAVLKKLQLKPQVHHVNTFVRNHCLVVLTF